MHKLHPVAAHVFLLKNNCVLLLRRFNTGFEDGNYSVVAGHVESKESVTQAAIRETKEEAGVLVNPCNLNIVGVMHRFSTEERIDFFFSTDTWIGKVNNMEPNKSDHFIWCPLNQLPDNTIPYIKQALHNFHNKIWFSEFGWKN